MSKRVMKSQNKITIFTSLAILVFVIIGCETGPPKIGEVIVSDKKGAKESNLKFQPKDTIHVLVDIENNLEDMKIKSNMTLGQDIYDLKKNDIVPGTDGTDNFDRNADKRFLEFFYDDSLIPAGKYNINIELQDRDGKKVDSRSIEIEVEGNDESEEKSAYSPSIGNGGD